MSAAANPLTSSTSRPANGRHDTAPTVHAAQVTCSAVSRPTSGFWITRLTA
jgi:hypothetical protein